MQQQYQRFLVEVTYANSGWVTKTYEIGKNKEDVIDHVKWRMGDSVEEEILGKRDFKATEVNSAGEPI